MKEQINEGKNILFIKNYDGYTLQKVGVFIEAIENNSIVFIRTNKNTIYKIKFDGSLFYFVE